jgi:hypothetical protein
MPVAPDAPIISGPSGGRDRDESLGLIGAGTAASGKTVFFRNWLGNAQQAR